jgi:ABC-type multidrug transport system ATPase subunit
MIVQQGIIAEKVTRVYSNRKRQGWFRTVREDKIAVKDVSFQLPPGQVTGLLGLNGAGKTTTIKMLSTLLLPTAVKIKVDGLDMQQHTTTMVFSFPSPRASSCCVEHCWKAQHLLHCGPSCSSWLEYQ